MELEENVFFFASKGKNRLRLHIIRLWWIKVSVTSIFGIIRHEFAVSSEFFLVAV